LLEIVIIVIVLEPAFTANRYWSTIVRADCPIKASGAALALVALSMAFDPAPPVLVTVPPESDPVLSIGKATTAFCASFVKKYTAFPVVAEFWYFWETGPAGLRWCGAPVTRDDSNVRGRRVARMLEKSNLKNVIDFERRSECAFAELCRGLLRNGMPSLSTFSSLLLIHKAKATLLEKLTY
jgi:hypothetical protein